MAKQRTVDTPGDSAASEDTLAFRAAVKDVKPLTQVPPPQGLTPAAARRTRLQRRNHALALERLDEIMPLVDPVPGSAGTGQARATTGGDALSFQRAGVQTQVVRRLRRGLYPIEGELDLHGLTQAVARDHLARFLTSSRDAGRRCVRIIHGKGYRSGARGPVLKIAVDSWLRRHLDVMAFTSARPIDGGTGAVYVLLRA